jgi:hypothetical protein
LEGCYEINEKNEITPMVPFRATQARCHCHMDNLLIDNPKCISYRQGEVPERRERRREHE